MRKRNDDKSIPVPAEHRRPRDSDYSEYELRIAVEAREEVLRPTPSVLMMFKNKNVPQLKIVG